MKVYNLTPLSYWNDAKDNLLLKYANEHIFNAVNIKSPSQSTFYLEVLSRLFKDKIFKDLDLCMRFEYLYPEKSHKLLTEGTSLFLTEEPGSFGYVPRKQYLACRVNKGGVEKILTVEEADSRRILLLHQDMLIWDASFYNYGHLENLPDCTELCIEYVKAYVKWSNEFHARLNKFLET